MTAIRKLSQQQIEQAILLRQQGKTLTEIGKTFGVSYMTIGRVLQEQGVPSVPVIEHVAISVDIATLAYLAGLFDGEGSIVICCSSGKKNRIASSYWLQVGITNTDRELIDWLYDTFGGHISDNSHSPSYKRQRPCWAWRVTTREAGRFLKSIYPYLRIKKNQAEIAIEFQEHMSSFAGNKALSKETLEMREGYRSQLRALTLGEHSLALDDIV